LGGGSLVAAVGWLDDHRSVAAHWRVLAHTVAALWALWWLGGMPELDLGPVQLTLGVWGALLGLVAMVWLTNLYNFMDGIDGLAGTQAVVTGTMAALLVASRDPGLAAGCLALAAAALGFLWWNRPPARIFMGDVGSGMLGFCFAVLAVAGERHGSLPALIWTLLLALFVWDATFTLARRVMRGERWYQAHRSHAYQRLVQKGWSHARVTLAVLLVNLLFLAPLAWWASGHSRWLPAAVLTVAAGCWLLWRWSTTPGSAEADAGGWT
jgi:Fuc2NAc and GlcNAc transferase